MSRRRLALIGCLLHAPGLWYIGRVRLGPVVARANRVALAATALTTLAVALLTASGAWALATWTVGHFIWSGLLVRAALRGQLHDPARPAPARCAASPGDPRPGPPPAG